MLYLIQGGKMTKEEALQKHGLTLEELTDWLLRLNEFGLRGLKAIPKKIEKVRLS